MYRLELIGSNLKRLRLLISQLEPRAADEHAVRLKSLLIELVHARLQDRKLVEIIRGNLHLLARKIIERAGHTGEHYITSTTGEYWRMLLSAVRWRSVDHRHHRFEVHHGLGAFRALHRRGGLGRKLRGQLHRDAAAWVHAGHEAAIHDRRSARRHPAATPQPTTT